MRSFAVPLLVFLFFIGLTLLFIVPPIAQPQWYHHFADQRRLLGIPNFWNVVSNLPFLLVGVWAIWHLLSNRSLDGFRDVTERWMYLFLFVAVTLTGVGSAYYHWEPNNDRLVWDRLPIAITFMALFAIIIAERVDRRAGLGLFIPLVLLGAATVFYWHLTETWGRGDLRPYLLAQFYPIVAIAVMLFFYPAGYTRTENLYGAIGWYVGARLYEFLDKTVYSWGQIISGHTLKHIGAAVSCYLILSWIRRRRSVIHSTRRDVGPIQ